MNSIVHQKSYLIFALLSLILSSASWAQVSITSSIDIQGDKITGYESANSNQGFWSFEDQDLGDWQALIDLQFDVSTTGEVTDVQANSGSYSVKIQSGNDASVGAFINDNYTIGVFDTLKASIFVSSADLSEIEKVQIFFLHGPSWDFTSQDYSSDNLSADSWNELLLVAPEGIGNTNRIGIQFVGINASESSVLYIDDISITEYVPEIFEPEGTWGFENQVLGEWVPLVDLQFNNNTVGMVSSEQAKSGTYSAKIEVQNDATVGALVNNTYSIGVFDTLRAHVFIPSSEMVEIETVQIFFLHGASWDFTSTDYASTNLSADSWNELLLVAPEGIGNTQRVGIQFIGKESAQTSFIYIDDISVTEYVPEVFEPEGTWGFENQILGEWLPLVDLEFNNNTIGSITSEQVYAGSYAAKIQVASDANVGALVNNTYEVEVGDSMQAKVFIPSSELSDIETVQIFVLHGNNWDFISTDYASSALTADTWNNLLLVIPEGIGNTQRIGIQFIGKETSGTSFIYIDDITVGNGKSSTSSEKDEQPMSFELSQNYPNPFNPTTNISFTIPNSGHVTLEVFNMLGQKVATLVDAPKSAGVHTLTFDARNLSSGVYLYRIQAGTFSEIKRMSLIK